jgi:TRAP-type C4-dicarboxylate transport system substrate-binding protein
MKARSSFFRAALCAALALGCGIAQAQQKPVVWRFGHVFSVPNTLFDNVAMKEYPERIGRASNGMVKVEVVQGVVNPNTMLDALADGRIQMGSIVTAASSATHPRWHVLGLPGVLDKESDYPGVARNIVWPHVDTELRRRWGATITNMGAFTATLFFSRANSGPVDRIEKFKGLKYRTHSVELSRLIQQMGGAPVGLPFGELYSAMERRLVDAYTSTAAAVLGNGLFEVTGFAEDWPAGLGLWFYVVSEKALNALPPDIRKSVSDELAAIQKDLSERHLAEAKQGVAALAGKGVKLVQVPEAEKQQVREMARQVVWGTWLDRTGPEGRALLGDVLGSLGKKL